jgi:hypothetical protein
MSSIKELFGQELKVINMGLKSFADDLKGQGVRVVHVDWRPPAGGKGKMLSLLERLKDRK